MELNTWYKNSVGPVYLFGAEEFISSIEYRYMGVQLRWKANVPEEHGDAVVLRYCEDEPNSPSYRLKKVLDPAEVASYELRFGEEVHQLMSTYKSIGQTA